MKTNHKSQSSLLSIGKLKKPSLLCSHQLDKLSSRLGKLSKDRYCRNEMVINKKSKFVRQSFIIIEKKQNIQNKYNRNILKTTSLEQSIQQNKPAFNHKMSVRISMLQKEREGKLRKFFCMNSRSNRQSFIESDHSQCAKTFYKVLPFWKKNKFKIKPKLKTKFSKVQNK